jgi:predicted enzyme related to lactoylglutathione lyase
MLYFYVTDVDASTNKLKETRRQRVCGPDDHRKVGRMSVVNDPQHAGFAMFTPLPH